MTLAEFLESKGFPLCPLDGTLARFDRSGPQTGWFRGHVLQVGGKPVEYARCGDWKTDEEYEYCGPHDPDQTSSVAHALHALKASQAEEKAKTQAHAAETAERLFARALTLGRTAYLERKKVDLFGARIDPDNCADLLVPLRDIDGKLWSLQFIRPEKVNGTDKNFLGGGRIKGCFHVLRAWEEGDPIYVAEGFATAGSIALSLGPKAGGVVCAFNAGNLLAVTVLLRLREPRSHLIVCGDDDRFTTRPNGQPSNPGREKATAAFDAITGPKSLYFPTFPLDAVGRPTDFNDLHLCSGLKEVTRQLEPLDEAGAARPAPKRVSLVRPKPKKKRDAGEPLKATPAPGVCNQAAPKVANPTTESTPSSGGGDAESGQEGQESAGPRPDDTEHVNDQTYAGAKDAFGQTSEIFSDVPPIEPMVTAQGKVRMPAQQEVVNHLLNYLGEVVIKQDRDLFMYTGTHWRWLTPGDHDRLRMLIQRSTMGRADAKFINATFQLLMYHWPSVPEGVSLFCPNPFAVNFLNGTLHITPKGRGFELIFTEHRSADWIVNVLPYDYRAGDSSRNAEFDAMLGRVFADAPDVEQRIRAVRQMFGAALAPVYPHLFMLHGGPGTGKSTVLKIAARLVHKDNLCSVPPSEFQGFNMETMAGKLVNLDTDIPLDMPLRDEIVKKVIDRQPFRIRRKGVKDIYAPLPSVHMFGGNDIPKAMDSKSKAHDRRWTFIEFSAFVPKGNYDREYWDYCFEQNPQGVLNFALDGLRDLLQEGGHFLNPDSGKVKMEEWQRRGDLVGQFVHGIKEGDVSDNNTTVILGNALRVTTSQAWEIFKKWYESEYNSATRMGRTTFFEQLRRKGFKEHKTKTVRYVCGFGTEVADDSMQ